MALLVFLFATPAEAQTIRVQTQLPIFQYFDRSFTSEGSSDEILVDGSLWGVFGAGIGLDVGTVLDSGFVFGLRGFVLRQTFTQTIRSVGEPDVEEEFATTRFRVGPYVEYHLDTGSVAQPSFRFFLGFLGEETETTSLSAFDVGGIAFLHLFPMEGFSIAPYFEVAFDSGSLGVDGSSTSVDYSAVEVFFGVSLGGWIPTEAPEDEEPRDERDEFDAFDSPRAYRQPPPSPPMPSRPTPENAAIETVLVGDLVLNLVAVPGREVEFRAAVPARGPCRGLRIGNDQGHSELTITDRAEGMLRSAPRVRLIAEISPGLLRQWLAGARPQVTVCGQPYPLGEPQRRSLRDYLRRMDGIPVDSILPTATPAGTDTDANAEDSALGDAVPEGVSDGGVEDALPPEPADPPPEEGSEENNSAADETGG